MSPSTKPRGKRSGKRRPSKPATRHLSSPTSAEQTISCSQHGSVFCRSIPQSGKVRFQYPFGRKGPTVTAANPVVINDHVFITASYGIGSAFVNLASDSPEVVWRDADLLASQYTTCIEYEGSLIGIDGRQDGPAADLKCFDPFTRTIHWTEPAFGYATLLKAKETLLALKSDGTLVAIAPSKQGYRELARATIFTKTTRALPALSDGKLYLRDTGTLKCVDLRAGS